MNKYIVIGAGILGASTAYHLAKAGAEVVVIDRQDPGQATDAAAGIVCPWISQRRNKAWYQLAKGGAKFYPGLIAELERLGETKTGYGRVGAISIHKDAEKLLAMEKRALQRKTDAPEMGSIRLLSPSETKELFPPIADGYGSIHISGAARVDGRALRDALLRAAERFGAFITYGDASLLFEENRVIGVKAEGKEYNSSSVIITAGAWADHLLAPLGIQFKVDFQKAQIVHLRLPDVDTSKWPVVMPPSDQYMLAFDDGRIVAGATHENDTGFDDRVTLGGMLEVFQKALQFAPGLADSTVMETRVGFRPFTPGFLPVIGPLPAYEGIFIANGLGSSGLTTGPYIGSELAKLALGMELEIDLANYDVNLAI